MKKIVLISKFNEEIKALSDRLGEYCQVQLCSFNDEVVRGMLDLVKPDLIFVAMTEDSAMNSRVFTAIRVGYEFTPTMALGEGVDIEDIRLRDRWTRDHIRFLARPIENEEIVDYVKQVLGTGAPAPYSTDSVIHAAPGKEKKTVLVVDDSPMMLRTMEAMLRKKYKVVFAVSGPKALDVVDQQPVDLILLDYNMPQVDGRMTFQRLRASEATKDIPVIFLTGNSKRDQVESVLQLQPEGYLLKPPAEERVLFEIEKVLEEHEQKMLRKG